MAALATTLLEEFMQKPSDPRVKNWLFLENPLTPVLVIAIYLLTVFVLLPAYMKNRKPYQLTTVIKYYNVFQIISCCAIIYRILSAGWWQGKYTWRCQQNDYSNSADELKLLEGLYWYFLLKMIEMVETMFFVLRKKSNQLSGLHVYHHASTFFLAWLGCKVTAGCLVSLPVMVNSFIHVIMYIYYYLASLGPKWQKRLAPWKSKLTVLQMIQFTFLLLHAATALQPDCNFPKRILLLYVPNVVLIFKMFYDFYTRSYSKKNRVVVKRWRTA